MLLKSLSSKLVVELNSVNTLGRLELAAQSLHEKLDQLQRGIDSLTGSTGRFSGESRLQSNAIIR